MPKSRADDDIKVLVPITGIRHNTDGQPVIFLCALTRRFHNPIESAADKRFVVFGNKATNFPSHVVFFRCCISSTDHRNLSHALCICGL